MTSSTKFDQNLFKDVYNMKATLCIAKKVTIRRKVFGIKYLFPFLNTNLSEIFCAQLNISELRSRCAETTVGLHMQCLLKLRSSSEFRLLDSPLRSHRGLHFMKKLSAFLCYIELYE
jgi:hypothetical protein